MSEWQADKTVIQRSKEDPIVIQIAPKRIKFWLEYGASKTKVVVLVPIWAILMEVSFKIQFFTVVLLLSRCT